MAALTQSLNQDNGLGIPFNAGANLSMSNVQHGGKLLGKKTEGIMKPRRPLQELNCANLENLGSSKAMDNGAFKATKCYVADKPKQEKAKKNGGRRALGDLTNLSKPSRKNGSLKLSSVTEKGEVVPDLAEEGCLHDHRECMKAQRHTMDIDYFLETVGLRKDCPSPIVTPKLSPLTTSKLESPTRLEFGTLSPLTSRLESPMMPQLEHVNEMEFGIEWDSLDFSGFKMKE